MNQAQNQANYLPETWCVLIGYENIYNILKKLILSFSRAKTVILLCLHLGSLCLKKSTV